jgi:hypothetical protein
MVALFAGLLSVLLLGCGQEGKDAGKAAPLASATGRPETRSQGRVNGKGVARSELRMLGPDEVRVAFFVVPGDAPVEVDGLPVRRRNGVIELVGKVGDVRRVRAFKGAKATEEKIVTIRAKEAEPSLLDTNEQKAAAPLVSKPKPAQFDVDE